MIHVHNIGHAFGGLPLKTRIGAGAGLAVAIGVLLFVLLRPPADIAAPPSSGLPSAAAPGTAALGTTAEASGQLAGASDNGDLDAASADNGSAGIAPLAIAQAELQGAGSATPAAVSKYADALEGAMNEGVERGKDGREARPGQDVSPAVKAAGSRLEAVGEKFRACVWAPGALMSECWPVIPPDVTFVKSLDITKGYVIETKSTDGHVVRYAWSRGAGCRSLDAGKRCDEWVAA